MPFTSHVLLASRIAASHQPIQEPVDQMGPSSVQIPGLLSLPHLRTSKDGPFLKKKCNNEGKEAEEDGDKVKQFSEAFSKEKKGYLVYIFSSNQSCPVLGDCLEKSV